jgi:site-specific DNA recombinase
MRLDGGGYRRDHLRAFAQRVEVAEREVFIKGSKDELLRTLAAIGGGNWRAQFCTEMAETESVNPY